jgi:hypothetical protein
MENWLESTKIHNQPLYINFKQVSNDVLDKFVMEASFKGDAMALFNLLTSIKQQTNDHSHFQQALKNLEKVKPQTLDQAIYYLTYFSNTNQNIQENDNPASPFANVFQAVLKNSELSNDLELNEYKSDFYSNLLTYSKLEMPSGMEQTYNEKQTELELALIEDNLIDWNQNASIYLKEFNVKNAINFENSTVQNKNLHIYEEAIAQVGKQQQINSDLALASLEKKQLLESIEIFHKELKNLTILPGSIQDWKTRGTIIENAMHLYQEQFTDLTEVESKIQNEFLYVENSIKLFRERFIPYITTTAYNQVFSFASAAKEDFDASLTKKFFSNVLTNKNAISKSENTHPEGEFFLTKAARKTFLEHLEKAYSFSK